MYMYILWIHFSTCIYFGSTLVHVYTLDPHLTLYTVLVGEAQLRHDIEIDSTIGISHVVYLMLLFLLSSHKSQVL